MILGFVNADYEAKVNLFVHGPKRQEEEIEAVVDTGFDGWLTLPAALISSLTLPFRRRGRAVLADGSETVFNIYEGTVIWDGQPRRILVEHADIDPLVGMSLLYGNSLSMQIVEPEFCTRACSR